MTKLISLVSFLFYASFTTLYYITLKLDSKPEHLEKMRKIGLNFHSTYGGRWKFLTMLDVLVQDVFFSLCALNALLNLFGLKFNTLAKLNNFIYTTVAFPVGCVNAFLCSMSI
jgi:hypothetical protein